MQSNGVESFQVLKKRKRSWWNKQRAMLGMALATWYEDGEMSFRDAMKAVKEEFAKEALNE